MPGLRRRVTGDVKRLEMTNFSEAGKVIQCGAEIVVSRSSDDSCGVMDKIHPVPFEMIHEEWLISEGLAARGPLAN